MKHLTILISLFSALPIHAAEQRAVTPAMTVPSAAINLPAVQAPPSATRLPALQTAPTAVMPRQPVGAATPPTPATNLNPSQAFAQPLKCSAYKHAQATKWGGGPPMIAFDVTNDLGSRQIINAGRTIHMTNPFGGKGDGKYTLAAALLPGQSITLHAMPIMAGGLSGVDPSILLTTPLTCQAKLLP